MLQFALLGSGSSGNAILINGDGGKILIDNGLSFRQLQLRAAVLGLTLDDLKAVFVTHEHSDHVLGLGVLSRKTDLPIYMTEGTRNRLPKSCGEVRNVRLFEAGDDIQLNGYSVGSFSVPHDAADPVSFVIRGYDAQIGLATDLGRASDLVRMRLEGSHALILESNYCPKLLTQSSYPPQIQQRIRGRQGHLSNIDACRLLDKLVHDALKMVVLVHISEENNTHDLALSLAQGVVRDHPARVIVAEQNRPTDLFEIRP